MSSPQERRAALTALIDEVAQRVDPPLLLDANPYFELAGEDFGRSLLLSLANDGAEYCLRPEFTIPIVTQYVRQHLVGRAAAYGYLGPVFRQHPDGPTEYVQAGLELLGQPDSDHALDAVFRFARRALDVYRVEAPVVRLGGVGLFEALLAAIEMPDGWRPRVRARFGHADAMSRLLDRLDAGVGSDAPLPTLPGRQALVEEITDALLAAGFTPAEGRHPEEVADRQLEKQALAASPMPPTTPALLRRYLGIEGEAEAALRQIESLAAEHRLDLAAPLAGIRARIAALRAIEGRALIRFDAGFSPRLDYYTGVVFEMRTGSGAVLASGGQYDRLLTRVGAAQPVTAAGCAVWVDRLEEELRA